MSIDKIFDIAGSGMSAQTLRLTTTASNLTNADVAASNPDETYKARYPVFQGFQVELDQAFAKSEVGVQVQQIMESDTPARKMYQPGHPQADKEGYVYYPDINVAEQMANLISASRSYQLNAQVLNTTKQLMLRTLQLGQ